MPQKYILRVAVGWQFIQGVNDIFTIYSSTFMTFLVKPLFWLRSVKSEYKSAEVSANPKVHVNTHIQNKTSDFT